MKKAVFAGTFDPITVGHEEIIKKASALFDELTVAICINPDKIATFSLEKRLDMLNAVCKRYDNVKVVYHQGLLVDLMKSIGAIYNVRGLRNQVDFEYEETMHHFNENLYPEMETIYIPCNASRTGVSSTAVKTAILKGESVEGMLSKEVIEIIKR